jgi:hypothetical protein
MANLKYKLNTKSLFTFFLSSLLIFHALPTSATALPAELYEQLNKPIEEQQLAKVQQDVQAQGTTGTEVQLEARQFFNQRPWASTWGTKGNSYPIVMVSNEQAQLIQHNFDNRKTVCVCDVMDII